MNSEQTIPLNLLVSSKANVRRTGKAEGIGELAASIEAHGLRQNLNVQPSDDRRMFEVVAGGRRLRAMKMLAKAGKLAEDAPVMCLVLSEGESGAEISLTETPCARPCIPTTSSRPSAPSSRSRAQHWRTSRRASGSPLPW